MRIRMWSGSAWMGVVTVVAFVAAAGVTATAQTGPRAVVRVTARDSTGAPIAGAELTLIRGVREVLASTTTDDAGHGVLAADVGDSTDLDVALRKIGYSRTDHFLLARPRDTASVTIVAARAVQALAPVKVTAGADVLRKSYHLDADDIEHSGMWFDNAWDVVKRLRPDMLTSRGGCPTGAQDVWVNGERIRLPLRPTGMVAAMARVGVPPRARFSYVPVSVLSEIAPEYISEINYKDCFDTSMAAVGSKDAIFVVLKPGVVYLENEGAFVLDTPAAQQSRR